MRLLEIPPMPYLKPVAVFAASALVVGCGLPPAPGEVMPADSIPLEWSDGAGPSIGEDTSWAVEWWSAFEDPVLDSLVSVALSRNLDLAEAVARIDEARARVGIATADLLPAVNGAANATRSEQPANAGFIGGIFGGGSNDSLPPDSSSAAPSGPDRFAFTDYTASLTLSWELDLWGRIRRDRAGAIADLTAGEEDYRAIRIGIVSETIRTYHEVLDLQRRVEINREVVDALTERADLAESRYGQGLVSSFELYQIRAQLRSFSLDLPASQSALADAERRLVLLAGGFPGDLDDLLSRADAAGGIGQTPPPPAGIPADVLVQRPDVRAAAQRLEGARQRVGARKASLFPTLTLSSTVGLQANEPDNLFQLDQWFNNLAAGLTAPLFQGGRIRANISVAEAQYAQQVVGYTRAVLTAVGEVEATFTQYEAQQDLFETITAQLAEAEAGLAVQSDRYAAGVGGYADYLDALGDALTVRASAVRARRDLAFARLALHRALGGTWVAPDTSSTTLP